MSRLFREGELISRARAFLGVDRAIFYTVVARSWSAAAGPVSLLFVARFLTPVEQGFYYTFSSIVALQILFELGLAFVIMQSASHEKAHLSWADNDNILIGDDRAKARLASLLRLALKWYVVVAVLVVLVLLVVGPWFFQSHAHSTVGANWRGPWILVVAFTGLNLMITPFVGVMEGCGKISEIASLHVRQAVFGSLAIWAALALGLKLYAAPVVAIVSVCAALHWLVGRRRRFFADLLGTKISADAAIRWRREILPFQWKIALSWFSGYFIFQLANPILFRYHGAAEAGRMGMTIRVIDSITALGFAWVSTKSAPFGTYIARRDFSTLDSVFRKASLQSTGAVVFGGATFVALYHGLRNAGVPVADRLVSSPAIYFLVATAVINCIIFNQAVYLRAHKQEPLLLNSVVGAIVVAAIMYFIGRPYGVLGISMGLFFGALLIGLPLATVVFYRKRREWHRSPNG